MIQRKRQFGRQPLTARALRRDTPLETTLVGTLSVARSGTGFVAPADGGEDIVIPQEAVGQAFPGDRVCGGAGLEPDLEENGAVFLVKIEHDCLRQQQQPPRSHGRKTERCRLSEIPAESQGCRSKSY